MLMANAPSKKLALVLGVANQRSVAWAVTQSLLQRNFDCILTYQSERFAGGVNKLMAKQQEQQQLQQGSSGRILGAVSCNVQEDLPKLFAEDLPKLLQEQRTENGSMKFDSIVHSVAYADMNHSPLLADATWPVYAQAQHISAYSFLQVAQCAVQNGMVHMKNDEKKNDDDDKAITSPISSLIALSYIGAVRAAASYQCMGPAKAALESIVRGLASEYGRVHQMHVNAVSAGPMATLSSKGIPAFTALIQHVRDTAPLRRSVTQQEVGEAVAFLSTSTGITGQTIYVDAGYSSVVPVGWEMDQNNKMYATRK